MSEITRRPVARSRRDGKNVGRISPAERITMKQINEFQVGRINSNEPLFYRAVKPLKKEKVARFVKQLGKEVENYQGTRVSISLKYSMLRNSLKAAVVATAFCILEDGDTRTGCSWMKEK